MAIQTTYTETIRRAVPGMLGTMVPRTVISRAIQDVGGVGWPFGVSQGTTEGSCIVGGTLAAFLGITVLDHTVVNPAAADAYPRYAEVAVLTRGEVFALAPTGGVVTGDAVTFNTTTGALGKTADGTNLAIPGARWKFTAAAGALAIVELGIQRS